MSDSHNISTFVVMRHQLFEAGALIDISAQAREAGILVPTAITAGVNRVVADGLRQAPHPLLSTPDIETIYYDIAWMMMLNVLQRHGKQLRLAYEYPFPVVIGSVEHTLKAVCTPEGDGGSLVLTVLLPGED